MKSYQPILSIKDLCEGDVVRHEGTMVSYLVHGVYGNRASAIRNADITNPIEWRVLREISENAEDLETTDNPDDLLVLRVTTAYKQGQDHALRSELDNPYAPGTLEHGAWNRGRKHGQTRAVLPAAWMHVYQKVSGGGRYYQADLAEPPSHPEPQDGWVWLGARPSYRYA